MNLRQTMDRAQLARALQQGSRIEALEAEVAALRRRLDAIDASELLEEKPKRSRKDKEAT